MTPQALMQQAVDAAIPTLRTERLVLRAPRPKDVEAVIAFSASPRSAGVGGPHPRHVAWRNFLRRWGHVALRGFGPFTVARATDPDRAIGTVGPFHPPDYPEPELSWALYEGEGEGLAFEAATEARRFAYEVLGWTTAISICMDDNPRSQALARRLGCERDGAFEHPEHGTMPVWRHPSPEALAA